MQQVLLCCSDFLLSNFLIGLCSSCTASVSFFFKVLFLKIVFIYFFRVRGMEGEREGEKHQCVFASWAPPNRDLICKPGMCLTGNQSRNPLVCKPALSTLSHTRQGYLRSSEYLKTSEGLMNSLFYGKFTDVK